MKLHSNVIDTKWRHGRAYPVCTVDPSADGSEHSGDGGVYQVTIQRKRHLAACCSLRRLELELLVIAGRPVQSGDDFMMDDMMGMGGGMLIWGIVGVLLIVLLAVVIVKLLQK